MPMLDTAMLHDAADAVRGRWPAARPACGLILGSGWNGVAAAFAVRDALDYRDIPGLGPARVAGHAGRLLWADLAGVETFVFQGRRHWYEGEGWTPVALPVYLMKRLGVRLAVLTNASGGIRKDLGAGRLMLIADHLNLMGVNPLIGPADPFWGPRFPPMTGVYDAALRERLAEAARAARVTLHRGVYLAVTGPNYETPAEIAMFRGWGADLIGMSTVPEALLAHAAGLRVVAVSCISNLAAGVGARPLAHAELVATIEAGQPGMRALLAALWSRLGPELKAREVPA